MSLISNIGMVFARKWIGGVTVPDVILESRRLNGLGEKVVINYLGEDITDSALIRRTVEKYRELLAQMEDSGVEGSISVKPTQLGLSRNYKLFLSNYAKIVSYAAKSGRFVWMDMEDYATIDASISAYLSVLKRSGNVGICIQAKLRRSLEDVKTISGKGGSIRLVKGAYPARQGITYSRKEDTDRNYLKCMDYLFRNSSTFMIATHDDRMIEKALALEKRYHKKALFGMLKGIRPGLALELASNDEDMQVYVPFGEEWMDYSVRRLKELEHSILIIRSIIGD